MKVKESEKEGTRKSGRRNVKFKKCFWGKDKNGVSNPLSLQLFCLHC